MKNKDIGIYIHIPFCRSKCGYCDFTSFAGKESKFTVYKEALIKEIVSFSKLYEYKIKTIFIGGGTPTVLPSYFIEEILSALYKYNVSSNAEITIESNPGTLNINMLRILKAIGVNRISMGLQAWQNKLLRLINRSHKIQEFEISYNNAVKLGFKNINVDLIFSLPQAKFKDWVETLKNVTVLSPTHISVYSLTIEEGTPFYKQYQENKLILTSQEEDRRMYHFAKKFLSKKGYKQYEISNFCKGNFQSKHNNLYWKRGSYKGFGLGAHSFLDGVRSNNTTNLDEYIKHSINHNKITRNINNLTNKEAMEEFMFLGLRLTEGINKLLFKQEFNINIEEVFGDVIQKNLQSNLIEMKNNKIYLTNKGMDMSNCVMSDFLL